MEQYVAEQIVFFEFAFRESRSEVRTVYRNVELLQQVRQRTEVIFVTVRENYRGDVVAVLVEKTEVRNRNIHSIRRLLRKPHPGVENQHLVTVTHSHAIHSKLADTAERDDLEDTCHKVAQYSTLSAYETRLCRHDSRSPFCRQQYCSDADDAGRLLPHRRRVAGGVQ